MKTIYEDGKSEELDDGYDEMSSSSSSSSSGENDYKKQSKRNKESALRRKYEAKISELTKIIDTFKTKKNTLTETRQEDNMPEFELRDPFGYRPHNEKDFESKGPSIDYDQALDSDGWYGVGSAPTSVCAQIEENNRRLINELEKCKKRVMSGTRKRNTPSARKRKTLRRNSPKTLRRKTLRRNSPKTRKHKSVSRSPWRPG